MNFMSKFAAATALTAALFTPSFADDQPTALNYIEENCLSLETYGDLVQCSDAFNTLQLFADDVVGAALPSSSLTQNDFVLINQQVEASYLSGVCAAVPTSLQNLFSNLNPNAGETDLLTDAAKVAVGQFLVANGECLQEQAVILRNADASLTHATGAYDEIATIAIDAGSKIIARYAPSMN